VCVCMCGVCVCMCVWVCVCVLFYLDIVFRFLLIHYIIYDAEELG